MDWDHCLNQVVAKPFSGTLLRMVEGQEQIATNRLVHSLQEQAILEAMLEATKPPYRKESTNLHYLLATPFRYPPLQWGSRFGKRTEPSLLYGSMHTHTLLCEVAYYRCVFWSGMTLAPTQKIASQHTAFGIQYQTNAGLALQNLPFNKYQVILTHPSDYSATQALGAKMRAIGIQAFEYISARDSPAGLNIALFSPNAITKPEPTFQENWLCEIDAESVRFYRTTDKQLYTFPVGLFMVNGTTPSPA
jgi:hypothetical protein